MIGIRLKVKGHIVFPNHLSSGDWLYQLPSGTFISAVIAKGVGVTVPPPEYPRCYAWATQLNLVEVFSLFHSGNSQWNSRGIAFTKTPTVPCGRAFTNSLDIANRA